MVKMNEEDFREKYQKLSDNDMLERCIKNMDEISDCDITIEQCSKCEKDED